MKKLILLSLIASLSFSEVYYNNKETKKIKDDTISFEGQVYNISEYREYTEITIATKENGRIKTKINYTNNLKEGQKVRGYCSKYEYGTYTNCNIY